MKLATKVIIFIGIMVCSIAVHEITHIIQYQVMDFHPEINEVCLVGWHEDKAFGWVQRSAYAEESNIYDQKLPIHDEIAPSLVGIAAIPLIFWFIKEDL